MRNFQRKNIIWKEVKSNRSLTSAAPLDGGPAPTGPAPVFVILFCYAFCLDCESDFFWVALISVFFQLLFSIYMLNCHPGDVCFVFPFKSVGVVVCTLVSLFFIYFTVSV